MALSKKMSRFMSPLKAALLWGALNVSPTALESGAQKAEADEASLNQATEQVLEKVEEKLNEMLQDFGPEEAPVAPDKETENDFGDFADDAENGIMPDKNEPVSPEVSKETPKGEAAPATGEAKPEEEKAQTDTEGDEIAEDETSKDGLEEDDDHAEEGEAQRLPSEKGIITKGINAIRYWNEMVQLKKQMKDIDKELKQDQRALSIQNAALKGLNIEKWTLKMSKVATDIFRNCLMVFNCCGGCCILAFLIPATILIKGLLDTFSLFLGRMIKVIDEKIAAVTQTITRIKERIQKIQQQRVPIEQKLYILMNQSLIGGINQTKSAKFK